MYIIQSGFVLVMTPGQTRDQAKVVMATLGEGSVFGEIALLGISGMSRRTADVVSKGFSNLFILRKDDLEGALKHFPDAKRILNAKARRIMKENDERKAKDEVHCGAADDVIINCRGGGAARRDPALVSTVLALKAAAVGAGSSVCAGGQGGGSDVTSPVSPRLRPRHDGWVNSAQCTVGSST